MKEVFTVWIPFVVANIISLTTTLFIRLGIRMTDYETLGTYFIIMFSTWILIGTHAEIFIDKHNKGKGVN